MNQAQVIGHIMAITGVRGPEFAKMQGISKSSLYEVAKNKAKTPHVRKIISDTIGIPETEIWPEDKTSDA